MRYIVVLLLALSCVGCVQKVEEITTLHVKRQCYMDSRHLHQLSIDIRMDVPTSMHDRRMLVPVQRLVVSKVLGADYAGLAPLKAMDTYCMDLRSEYLKDSRRKVMSADYETQDCDAVVSWTARVCYQRGNLLSIESGRQYFTIDTERGVLLQLDDIIADRAALERVLGRPLTDNYCICDGALLFCFDGADGEVEKASVQLSSLREYLRKDWWWLGYNI